MEGLELGIEVGYWGALWALTETKQMKEWDKHLGGKEKQAVDVKHDPMCPKQQVLESDKDPGKERGKQN